MEKKSAWMIRAGQGGYLAGDFAEKSVVAIGWRDLGDLSNLRTREEIKELYQRTYPKHSPGKVPASVSVLHRFRNVIQPGDGVVSYDPNNREYLVGEITGDYEYDPALLPDHPNVRKVAWRSRVSRDALPSSTRNLLGSIITLFAINPEAWDELQASTGKSPGAPAGAEAHEKQDFKELKRSREEEAHEALKDKLVELDPYEMQDLAGAILRAMGFKCRVSPPGADRGVDIFASPDGWDFRNPGSKWK